MERSVGQGAAAHKNSHKAPMEVGNQAVEGPMLACAGSLDLEVFVPPPGLLPVPPGLEHGWKGHPIEEKNRKNRKDAELLYYPKFGSGSGSISPPPGFADGSSQMMNNTSRLTESTVVILSTDSQSSAPPSGPHRVQACDAAAGWQELEDLEGSPPSPDSPCGTRTSRWVEDSGWHVETASTLQSYQEDEYREQRRIVIHQNGAEPYRGEHGQNIPYQECQRSREHIPSEGHHSYDYVAYIHHEHLQQTEHTSHRSHLVPVAYADSSRHGTQQGDEIGCQAQCSWHNHSPSVPPAHIQDSSRHGPENCYRPQHMDSTYTGSSYSHARDWLQPIQPSYGSALISPHSGEGSQSSSWRTASHHQVDLAQIARYSPQPQTPLPSWEDIVRIPEYPETHRNRSGSQITSQHHHTSVTDLSSGQRSKKLESMGHSAQHSSQHSQQGAYSSRQYDAHGLDSTLRDPPTSTRPSSSCGHGPYDGPVGLPSPGAEIWAPRFHGHPIRMSNAPRSRDPMRPHEEASVVPVVNDSRWNMYSSMHSSGEASAPYRQNNRRISHSWGGEQSMDSWTEDQSEETIRGNRNASGIQRVQMPSGVERYLNTFDRVEAVQQESLRRGVPRQQSPEFVSGDSRGIRFREPGDHYDLGIWGNPDRGMGSRIGIRNWIDTGESDAPSMWDVADGEGVAQEVEAALQAGVITRGVGTSDGTRWCDTSAMMRNAEAPDDSWGSIPNSFEVPRHEVYEIPGRAVVPGVVTAFNGLPSQRGTGDRELPVAPQHYPPQYHELHYHGSQGRVSHGQQRKGLIHGSQGIYSSQTPFLGESDAAKLQRARETQSSRASLRPRNGRSDRHLIGGIMTDRPVKYSNRHNNGGIRPMGVIDEPYGSNCIVDERILQHRAEKERRLTRAVEKSEGNTGFFQKTLGGILKDCVVPRAAMLCPAQDKGKSSHHSRSQNSVSYNSSSPGGNPSGSGGYRPRPGIGHKNSNWAHEGVHNP